MKKLIIAICMLCVLAFSAVAGASAESNALSSEQKAAEKLFSAISGKTTDVATVCSPALLKKLDAKALTGMQASVASKLGTVKSNRLFSFERFGKADRLVYLGSFSKEKLVRYIVVFSPENPNLITEFALGPVEQNKQAKK